MNAGADTNLQDAQFKTALVKAATAGHTEMACLLLDAGADKDVCAISMASLLWYMQPRKDTPRSHNCWWMLAQCAAKALAHTISYGRSN